MLNWWLPENVSTYGEEIDWLFHLIYYITGAVFIIVTVAFLSFIVIYRDRPGRRARYTHGNTPLEIVWTVVPALILLVLTFLSVPAWSKIKMTMPQTDLLVQATGKQFNWQVTYPGPDGQFGTADDKTFLDEMHVPVGKPIRINLKSQDVIHSFFVPSSGSSRTPCPGARSRSGSRSPSPASTRCRAPSSAASDTRACGPGSTPTPRRTTPSGRPRTSGPGRRPPPPRRSRSRRNQPPRREGEPSNERHQRYGSRAHRSRGAPRGGLRADLHLLDRSQDDRAPVPVPGALHDDPRGPAGADGPLGAGLARDAGARPRLDPHRDRRHTGAIAAQHGLHHARDPHDLLRHHADPGRRFRQLLHPAHDRGPGHGLPLPQHAVLLGGRALGHPDAQRFLRPGRARGRRVDLLRAAQRGAGVHGDQLGAEPVVHQPLRPRCFVDDGGDQLHHDHHQHAGARDEALPHAAGGVVAVHHRHPAAPGPARAHLGRGHAPLRPHAGHELVQAVGRRRAAALAAPVLVLRSPRGLHSHPARHGHRFGDPARLRAQADLRLPRHGLLDDRHRLPLLGGLRPPHVRERHEPGAGYVVHGDHDDHPRPVGLQHIQLVGHAVGRPHPIEGADAERAGLRVDVRHRRALGPLHGLATGGHLHPGHLLHRGPHPLCGLRRLDLRRLRGHLLLVPEDVRPPDEHGAGASSLLADLRLLQPHLLPHAHHRRGRPDAAHLQPAPVRVPPAPAALERLHHVLGAPAGPLPDPVRDQLLLVALRRPAGAPESLELEHAPVDGALAPAAPELGADGADRVPRALRVHLAGVERGLPAAVAAAAGACRGRATLSGSPEAHIGMATAHRLALVTAAAMLVLILFGGLVTNTGSALAVPDWPTTFGHSMFLYPWSQMVGGIFYEHSHRLLGALVGLLTLALAAVLWRAGGGLRWLRLPAVP